MSLAKALSAAGSPVLVIPSKPDIERDAVAEEWESSGGEVLRLDRFWEPPPLDRDRVRVYGPATFCWVVAAKVGLELLGPPDDLLLALPSGELGRAVDGVTLEAAVRGTFPRFVKPVVPKQFMAAVYESGDNLAAVTVGLEPDVLVMVSDVVSFDAEARLFIDSGSQVVAHAVFEGDAESDRAVERGSQIAERLSLDVPYVMDLGLLEGQWFVVEFNEAWGSGLNGCAASGAALAILQAVTTD